MDCSVPGKLATVAGKCLLSLADKKSFNAASSVFKQVKNDWPSFLSQSSELGCGNLTMLSSNMESPDWFKRAVKDLEKVHSGGSLVQPVHGEDGYVRTLCAIFSWEVPLFFFLHRATKLGSLTFSFGTCR